MTPRAPSKERVEELRGCLKERRKKFKESCVGLAVREEWVVGDWFFRDLLAILDDYSAMRERMELAEANSAHTAEWIAKWSRAEAELEKQRPLIDEAMRLSEVDAEMGEVGGLVRAALKYREGAGK